MPSTAIRRIRRVCSAFGALLILSQPAEPAERHLPPAALQRADGAIPVSKDWKRLSTPDLIVVGNASEGDLRRTLKEIEDFRDGLLALFPGLKLTSRTPTTLMVLKDVNSFKMFQPRDERGRRNEYVAGYFMTAPHMNYMVLGAYGDRDFTFELIFHEYTHFVVQQNFRSVPTWLNEGLADFYSTFQSNFKNGQSLVGTVPKARLATIRSRSLMPLDRILTNDGAAALNRDPNNMLVFYAESWALVHYLQLGNDGKRRGQIGAYLRALDQGLPINRAFDTAFNTTPAQMQGELDTYLHAASFPALLFTPRTRGSNVAAVSVEPLRESDAAFIQGDVLLQVGATDDAERLLSKALSFDSNHSDAKISLGRVRHRQGRTDDAISQLQAIAAAEPSAFLAHVYLAEALRAGRRYDEAVRAAERAVAIDRDSPYAWYELNLSALALGRDSQADDAVEEAMRRDSNPSWHRSRTYDAYTLGRDEAVIRSARAYVAAAGRGNESAPYVAYAAALASMRLGRRAEAATFLEQINGSVPLGSWQDLVAQYLLERLPADTLLAKAKTDGERTEAHAYVGALAAALGHRDDALVHLRWVKEKGLKNYVEYRMAVTDLDRLDEPAKPSR